MATFNFITVRLGKDSIPDIQKICASEVGVLDNAFTIKVKCTQVPDNYGAGDYAFLWLGSDNNKGMPTQWKQGFKAVGCVKAVDRGASYNDTSETTIEIVYIFHEAVNRMDILRCAPVAYYWCSSMPLIGIDDHANQTIRNMTGSSFSDIRAFFYAIESVTNKFKADILQIEPAFGQYFNLVLPNPKNHPSAKNIEEVVSTKDNKTKIFHFNFLTALRTKPFMLLAGISGTGKSRIVRKLAQASVTEELQRMYDPKSVEKGFKRWELHKPANFELIQVKPNWHNSLEVVGYKSNIGGAHYEFTPFVEFVARAWKHPQVPFFLCLDEMNLAPVEQYFAEFLSAIESRSVENGEYETDPIVKPFNSFNTKNDEGIITDNLSDRMIAHLVGKLDTQRKSEIADRFRTKGLTLPQNLLVMGTVNMDETTFSFSRKVLDRAMSVVMNTVEYDKFFSGESEQDVAEMNDETRRLLIDRPIRGLDAEDNGADEVKDYLTAINGVLQDTPFQLGYRAANEALLYVSAARAFDHAADIKAALDEFTLMKVLSRIEGDKRSIDDLLARLQNVIDKSYPKSQDKLGKMAETLQKKQFVSYWT